MASLLQAVGYARVSTLTQVHEGDGLGVQRERIAAWCAYQQVPLLTVAEDAGISGGTTDNRPAFRGAMRAVLGLGSEGVLVTYSLSRLGRDALDVQAAVEVLLHAGVRVVAISDGIDSASGMGATILKTVISILSMVAELEKDTIRSRLLDGRKRADASNKIYASEPRYGRRVANVEAGALEAAPEELRAVERAKALRAEGHSYRAIAGLLTTEGYKPRRAPKWDHVVVARMATGQRTPRKSTTAKRIERARAEWLGDAS